MSGSTIGGVVGAAIGFWIGGPQGAQWGWMIGSAVGGYIDPTQIQGPRLQDARTQTSRDGVAIPFGWGTFPLAGNIIWQQPTVTEHKNTETQGKGGPEVTTYTYTRSYAIGLCEGPITGILQIKRNGKLVYDARDDATLEAEYQESLGPVASVDEVWNRIRLQHAMNTRFISNCEIYLGDETQVPDPTIESYEGVGNVPAYRGLAYIVVTDDDVTDLQGAIPQLEFVVASCGTVTDGSVLEDTYLAFAAPLSAHGSVSGTDLITGPDITDWGNQVDVGIPTVGSLVEHSGGRLFVFDGSVGKVSTNLGQTWESCTGIPAGKAPYALGYDGAAWWLLVENNDGFLYKSLDGISFSAVSYLGATDPGAKALYVSESAIIVSGVTPRRSTDGGSSFSTITTLYQSGRSVDGFAAAGTAIVAISRTIPYNKYLRSTDDGATWTELSGLPASTSGSANASRCEAIASSGSLLVIARVAGECLVSSDDGATFTNGGATLAISGAEKANRLVYAGEFVLGTNAGIQTSPTGAVWTTVYTGGSSEGAGSIAVIEPGDFDGVAIPDAPGYYVGADGTVYGPSGTTVSPCIPSLDEIVANLCERDGLTSEEYDVTDLAGDLVPGFRIANEGDAASAIAALIPAYFFDVGEWDGKVRFIKRSGTSSFSINGDDLVERDGDSFERERVQEAELLRRVTVGYIDPAAAYGPTTQKWERRAGTVQAKGEASMELPLTLLANPAATIAKKRGLAAWGEPEKQKFSLPYRLAALTPTDVGTYTDADGEIHAIRLMQAEDDSGVRYMESSTNSAEAYGATATGVSPKPPTIGDSSLRGPTILVAMNLDSLRSSDNVPGIYLAACGITGGWQGCTVEMSVDGGVSYQPLVSITSPARMGYLTADIGTSGEPLSVFMRNGSISSVTTDQIAAGVNAFAITSSGVSEVGQAQTATAGAGSAYDLTDLTRGVGSTSPASHSRNDPFVMLDSAVVFVPVDVTHAGETLYLRPVTLGTSSDAATAQTFVYEPPTFVIDGGGA